MNDAQPRSLSRDYAVAFAARGASVATSALLTIVTARMLGTTHRGGYVLLATLVTMLWTVGNCGFGLGSTFHAGQRTFAMTTLRTNALMAAAVLGSVLAGIGYLVADGLAIFGDVPPAVAAIAVLGVPAVMGAQFLGAILLGAQRIREYNLLLIAYSVAQLVLIGGACVLFGTLRAAVVASLLAQVLWFVLSLRATHQWRTEVASEPGTLWRATKAILAYGIRGQLGNIVQLLNYRLDFFLVSAFLGTAPLGVYSVAVMIAEALWQMSNSMAVVLFPRVAALGADFSEQRRIVSTAARVALGTTLIGAVALGLTVNWWVVPVFGRAYADASAALLLLLPGVVLFTVTVVLASGIAGAGYPELNSYVAAATLVMSVTFDLWLIPRMGVPGAALASSLTYIASTLLTTWIYVRLSGASLRDILSPRLADVQTVLGALRSLAPTSSGSLRT